MIDIDGFERFLYEEELSKNTCDSYLYALRNFAADHSEVNKVNVVLWKQKLINEKAPKTVNLRLSAMEKYCRFKGIELHVKRVRIQKPISVEDVITLEEYKRLLDGLISENNTRYAIIVALMSKTGARISEVTRLKKRDLKNGYVDLRSKGKIRRIYFPESVGQQMEEWVKGLSDDEYLCQNRYGKKISARAVSKYLKECAKRFDIPEKHLHPHAFRHMFAIEFLKRNKNISFLADILGHTGLNTTMIYLRMSQEQQRQEIDKSVDW